MTLDELWNECEKYGVVNIYSYDNSSKRSYKCSIKFICEQGIELKAESEYESSLYQCMLGALEKALAIVESTSKMRSASTETNNFIQKVLQLRG
jgi:hypothetical protein